MGTTMFVLRLVPKVWYFLWEMFLGEITLSQAIRTSKLKLAILAGMLLSVFFNYLLLERIYRLTEYTQQSRARETLLKVHVDGIPDLEAEIKDLKLKVGTLELENERLSQIASSAERSSSKPGRETVTTYDYHRQTNSFFKELAKKEKQESLKIVRKERRDR